MTDQQQTEKPTRAPLRLIIDRPDPMLETLECGHTISRTLGLGEDAQSPSKARRRRCHCCVIEKSQRIWEAKAKAAHV